MNNRILLLFSGGLDSMLAVKTLQDAGADVTALVFKSAFFDEKQAIISAKIINVNLIVQDISEQHLKIVKNPAHGRGKNLNPCIDCHALMLTIANEIAIKNNFQMIATGEVMGQRPFSQTKRALLKIEKICGLENHILRPLSAKLLPETSIEQLGIINRDKLQSISGRSRKPQISLAKQYGIDQYPAPAGGCRLTDPQYAERGSKLLTINDNANADDFEIIRYGRMFVIENSLIIIGRDHLENNLIQSKSLKTDILIKMLNYPGPAALIRVPNIQNHDMQSTLNTLIQFTKEKIIHYAAKAQDKNDIAFEVIIKTTS